MTIETWFFTKSNDDSIVLISTSTGKDGSIGDARSTIRPGDRVANLSYADLAEWASGEIEISDGVARIV